MKLLVVSHACATAVNQDLYAAVARLTGWDVTLVVPVNWKDEYGRTCTVEQWPAFKGRLLAVPVRKPGSIILHSYRTSFKKLIRSESPDAIYVAHEPYATATAQIYFGNLQAGNRGSRSIGFYSAQNISKRYPLPFRVAERWVLRSSDFAFPVSETVARVLGEKGFTGENTVLPLAIDRNLYRPHPDAEAARRELLGNSAESAMLLGYVGRLVPEKGLATLMAACGLLANAEWKLALIGVGSMESELRQQAAALGIADRVIFKGFVPHVETPKYLSAFDALVLPSETQTNWKEQFGRVVLEAMACGTPVIGSDSGEIPFLIRNTQGGLTFHERDPRDLARAIGQLMNDVGLRQRFASAGREAVSRYEMDAVAAAFIATVRKCESTRKPATGFGPAARTAS